MAAADMVVEAEDMEVAALAEATAGALAVVVITTEAVDILAACTTMAEAGALAQASMA